MYKMWKCITGKCKILYQMRNESRSFSAGSNPAKSDTAESFSTTAGTDTAADPGKTGKPGTTATTKKNEKVTKTKNSEKYQIEIRMKLRRNPAPVPWYIY